MDRVAFFLRYARAFFCAERVLFWRCARAGHLVKLLSDIVRRVRLVFCENKRQPGLSLQAGRTGRKGGTG
jgi:hypothetical protein